MIFRAPDWFVVLFWIIALGFFVAVCWSAWLQARDADWQEKVLDQINSHDHHP